MATYIRRREFISTLGGMAVAWPLAARAQQRERMRRVGVLMGVEDDPQNRLRIGAFVQRLRQLGWIEGRNVQIDYRWAVPVPASARRSGDADRIRRSAVELVALAPDVSLTSGSDTLGALLQATHTVPIVFATVPDPVGSGFVDSLARPGGNATGFDIFENSFGGKSLRHRRRLDLLWAQPGRLLRARGRIRRSHSQGREACRPTSAGNDQIRAGD